MNKKIVFDFINAINEHNVGRIYSLMTDDFKFIDTYGGEEIGKDHMRESWIGYFQWFPDYQIEIVDTFDNDNVLAIFGFASGTYKNVRTEDNKNYWRLPAAWKAATCDNKVKIWQVYCDSKIPYDIMSKA